jgi:hypothetical protein
VSLCVQCGYPTSGADDMCAHHTSSHADDWAMGNRIMCDFLHRGVVSPPSEWRPTTLTRFMRHDGSTSNRHPSRIVTEPYEPPLIANEHEAA